MKSLDAQGTAALTPYPALVEALRVAAIEVAGGAISCPPRTVLTLAAGGAVLSMLASGADLAAHKLVTVVPTNLSRRLPTIQGEVSVWDATTGSHLVTLDGATVTGRRTAALSLLGISVLLAHRPRHVRLFGTGTQARHHVEAVAQTFPDARIVVSGRSLKAAEKFCIAHATISSTLSAAPADSVEDEADVIITCTTSQDPVYRNSARAGRLVIAIGSFTPVAAEIDAATVRASCILVDDLDGARQEAGDLIRAGVDWTQVQTLAQRLLGRSRSDSPLLFKTVGCAAWDLAAARVAVGGLSA